MNIGQAVREALDPFGVDVDIEVETPEGKQKVEKAKEARENKTSEANDRFFKAPTAACLTPSLFSTNNGPTIRIILSPTIFSYILSAMIANL